MAAIKRIEFSFPEGTVFRRGVCVVCGCTQERGCPDGCFWIDKSRHLCSVCFANALDVQRPAFPSLYQNHTQEGAFEVLVLQIAKPRAPVRRKGAKT